MKVSFSLTSSGTECKKVKTHSSSSSTKGKLYIYFFFKSPSETHPQPHAGQRGLALLSHISVKQDMSSHIIDLNKLKHTSSGNHAQGLNIQHGHQLTNSTACKSQKHTHTQKTTTIDISYHFHTKICAYMQVFLNAGKPSKNRWLSPMTVC